jgi:uncharacterized coiled-coil DUF342 family protein
LFNELLAELENKISGLAQTLEELKKENISLREQLGGADALRGEYDALKSENEALRGERDELAKQLSGVKAEADGQRGKADAAAGRIKEIIAKLDSAR